MTIIRQSSGSHQAVIRQSSGSHQAVIRQSSDSHYYTLNMEWPWFTLYTILHNSNLEIHWSLEVTLFFEKKSHSVHSYKPYEVRFWAARFFSGPKIRVSQGLAVVTFLLKNAITFFFSGISKEGPPSRHLLPTLAISRPPVAPRIKSSRALWLCFSSAKGRSLCQSLSLHKNRSANSAASSRTYKYKKQRSKFQNSGLLNSIRFLRRPCSKKPYKKLRWLFEKISCKSTSTILFPKYDFF